MSKTQEELEGELKELTDQKVEEVTKEFAKLVYTITEHSNGIIPCGCVEDPAVKSRVFFLLEGCLIMAYIQQNETGTFWVSLDGIYWTNIPHSTGHIVPTHQLVDDHPRTYIEARMIGSMTAELFYPVPSHPTKRLRIPYIDMICIVIRSMTTNICGALQLQYALENLGLCGTFCLNINHAGDVVFGRVYDPDDHPTCRELGYTQYVSGELCRFTKPTDQIRSDDWVASKLCDKIGFLNRNMSKNPN